MKNIQIKDVNLQQFESIEDGIRMSHKSISDLEDSWQSLHEFFQDKSVEVDYKYRWTYFRLYTDFTYNLFNAREPDVIRDIAIPRQFIVALSLDYNIGNKLIRFLHHKFDEKSIQSFFRKMKDQFLESEAVVGEGKDGKVLFKDVVEKIKKIDRHDDDSIEKAEFLAEMRNVVYPEDDLKQTKFFVDPDDIVKSISGWIKFFLGVSYENIFYLIDSYYNPRIYGLPADSGVFSADEESLLNVGSDEDNNESKQDKEQLNEVSDSNSLKQDDNETNNNTKELKQTQENIEKSSTINFEEIKQAVESQFEKDDSGQYKSVEGVMKVLDSIARQQNNDKIRNLYYFDEEEGEFKWDEDLLEDDK